MAHVAFALIGTNCRNMSLVVITRSLVSFRNALSKTESFDGGGDVVADDVAGGVGGGVGDGEGELEFDPDFITFMRFEFTFGPANQNISDAFGDCRSLSTSSHRVSSCALTLAVLPRFSFPTTAPNNRFVREFSLNSSAAALDSSDEKYLAARQ